MDDFSPKPTKPRVNQPSVPDQYAPLVREWLIEDKTHHYKQRHTAQRVYERLQESFSDMNVSYTTISKLFRDIRSEVYYTHKDLHLCDTQ